MEKYTLIRRKWTSTAILMAAFGHCWEGARSKAHVDGAWCCHWSSRSAEAEEWWWQGTNGSGVGKSWWWSREKLCREAMGENRLTL